MSWTYHLTSGWMRKMASDQCLIPMILIPFFEKV